MKTDESLQLFTMKLAGIDKDDKLSTTQMINQLIRELNVDTNEISDGFHTFGELYYHRMLLSAIAFKFAQEKGWQVIRSRNHHDGQPCFGGGWFIVMVIRPDNSQYSYHYEEKYWNMFSFAETVDIPPEWDGHSPADIGRLLPLLELS